MNTKPSRIQRSRSKGWRKPADAIFVGRPSKWGNPYIIGQHVSTNAEAVAAYAKWLMANPTLMNDLHELSGKPLMCWCSLSEPCHGDVLLSLASLPSHKPPDANAGHAVGDYTHEVAATLSKQGHEVGRGKLAMAGAGEQGGGNNRTRRVPPRTYTEHGLQLPAKPCETFLT